MSYDNIENNTICSGEELPAIEEAATSEEESNSIDSSSEESSVYDIERKNDPTLDELKNVFEKDEESVADLKLRIMTRQVRREHEQEQLLRHLAEKNTVEEDNRFVHVISEIKHELPLNQKSNNRFPDFNDDSDTDIEQGSVSLDKSRLWPEFSSDDDNDDDDDGVANMNNDDNNKNDNNKNDNYLASKDKNITFDSVSIMLNEIKTKETYKPITLHEYFSTNEMRQRLNDAKAQEMRINKRQSQQRQQRQVQGQVQYNINIIRQEQQQQQHKSYHRLLSPLISYEEQQQQSEMDNNNNKFNNIISYRDRHPIRYQPKTKNDNDIYTRQKMEIEKKRNLRIRARTFDQQRKLLEAVNLIVAENREKKKIKKKKKKKTKHICKDNNNNNNNNNNRNKLPPKETRIVRKKRSPTLDLTLSNIDNNNKIDSTIVAIPHIPIDISSPQALDVELSMAIKEEEQYNNFKYLNNNNHNNSNDNICSKVCMKIRDIHSKLLMEDQLENILMRKESNISHSYPQFDLESNHFEYLFIKTIIEEPNINNKYFNNVICERVMRLNFNVKEFVSTTSSFNTLYGFYCIGHPQDLIHISFSNFPKQHLVKLSSSLNDAHTFYRKSSLYRDIKVHRWRILFVVVKSYELVHGEFVAKPEDCLPLYYIQYQMKNNNKKKT